MIHVRNSHFTSHFTELQELALKVFTQSTNASACESNWSTFEYIFSKRRNLLGEKPLEQLVYIHGNLRNINITNKVESESNGSSLLKYLESISD